MALTNEDLQAIAAMMDEKLDKKLDEKINPIKNDIQVLKKQGEETFKELMFVEKEVISNKDSLTDLHTKYDTLLLKADNTDLLLKLINRQSDEMAALKARIEQVEKKLA